jgi:hypothetical protein
MVLLTDAYRNVTSFRGNRRRICYEFLKKQSIKVELQCLEPGNEGFKQFKCPVRNVLSSAKAVLRDLE